MQTEIIWKTTLKNGIYGGLTPPLADPFNPDHFYITDGWGSKYASMRLHKLSFSTGKEVANVLIRNNVRCMYFSTDGQYIFAKEQYYRGYEAIVHHTSTENRWFSKGLSSGAPF